MNLHIEYICALTNLYGHVSPDRVCDTYNQHHDEQSELQEIEFYLTNPGQQIENRYLYIKQGKFLEEDLYLFEEKYEALMDKQEGKPHYIPEKEALLKYSDLYYWEKPAEYDELENYIHANFFPDDQAAGQKLTADIFDHIQRGNARDALRLFKSYEIIFEEEKDSDPVLYIIQRLSNNTRMQANNGYTPLELSEIMGHPAYILPVKLPKNGEECHCGSGKKYKDCHFESDENIKRLKDYRL